ncbi:hypothetical protein X760_27860 [Mesorhizobium sp. LSHC422A00]|nr:hypothetical protein X760_27860 [Mesorhizobium sp. LSHC422A00]
MTRSWSAHQDGCLCLAGSLARAGRAACPAKVELVGTEELREARVLDEAPTAVRDPLVTPALTEPMENREVMER